MRKKIQTIHTHIHTKYKQTLREKNTSEREKQQQHFIIHFQLNNYCKNSMETNNKPHTPIQKKNTHTQSHSFIHSFIRTHRHKHHHH